MFRTPRCLALLFAALLCSARIASAQVATGTPPFGSFGGGPDIIDLANLNVHIDVPMLNKPGRGMNFTYDMSYDSSVWYPVTSGSTTTWTPVSNWGWRGQTEVAAGYITHTTNIGPRCPNPAYPPDPPPTIPGAYYANYWYHDNLGVAHPFAVTGSSNPCGGGGETGVATDGSGYTIWLGTDGLGDATVTTSSGTSISPPTGGAGAAIVTDRNGNRISVNGSGQFYDTLSSTVPVLAITGSGTVASPNKFTYTPPSGTPVSYVMNYTNYTVATHFASGTISEYKSSAAVPLVTSIVLPDTSQYTFTYETTPGTCTPWSGSTTCTTARIISVTLPTGGRIQYAYSGGGTGVDGVLPDGSTATLTRTTPDGTWIYAQVKGTGAASTTTTTDPSTSSNQTIIQFQGTYETQRQVYQGSTSGTLLMTTNTCYNLSAFPCNSTAVTSPITERIVISTLPGTTSQVSQHTDKYNSFGAPTETDDYTFGPGAAGPLLRKVLYTYASLGNVTAFRQQVTVQNETGGTIAQTNYNYDETAIVTPTILPTPQHVSVVGSRGNLTSIVSLAGLTSKFTYFDTGNAQTFTDVNGAATTFTYGSLAATCGNTFPTGISEPVNSMTQSITWNCTGGVQLTSVDENNKTTSAAYTDPDYWRPASTTDPAGAVTNFCYGLVSGGTCSRNSTQSETTLSFGSSAVDTLTTVDVLGRIHIQQTRQAPASSSFDSVETDYDAVGRVDRVTIPYVATAGQATTSTAPAVSTSYDALSRVLSVSDSGGGLTSSTYTQNDVLSSVGPAPSGENPKRRQLEFDALSRISSVCEITSGPFSGSCGQTAATTGYWTKYAYDALGDLTGVTQNTQTGGTVQTRTYVYDAIGRLTSETNPETAQVATHYTYDSDSSGGCPGTYKGDLIKRVDAVGDVICYTYDALHRTLTITYPSGTYAASTPQKHFVYDTGNVNGIAMSNVATRLVEAYTCFSPCTMPYKTDLGFSYSARGELTDTYESTPHSTTYFHASQTYLQNGGTYQVTGNIGLPSTITYGADGEGRPTTVSASSGQNPVTAATYNLYASPNQLQVTFGSADTDTFTYDPNTFRLNKYQFKIGTQTVTGTLGWNPNASLGAFNISDPFSTANTQNCTFAAEDLARISQVSCGTVWGQSFSYDPFGNITKTKISGTGGTTFAPTYQSSPSVTNRVSQVGTQTPTYDANGNSLNDTIRTFTWDSDNNPITVGSATSLTYDALDRMVEQTTGGTNSQIVYSPAGAKLALMNGTALLKAFVPLPGGATAVYNSSGLAYYRHTDHLGSSRFASTPTQTLYSDSAYSPSGEVYASSGALDGSFTGQNQDTTPGLYDFLYREYDPYQSRWSSPDPSGLAAVDPAFPQSWNRYAYVLNNPVSRVDPQGLWCVWQDGTHDDDESDGGEGSAACLLDGGLWDSTDTFTGCDASWNCTDGNGFNAIGCTAGSFSCTWSPGGSVTVTATPCSVGWGSGGIGVALGGNIDLGGGPIPLGANGTVGAGAGVFHNKAGGVVKGLSAGAYSSGGTGAYAGSKATGTPKQDPKNLYSLGAYVGGGPSAFVTNAASVQQLKGPFTTASVNVGVANANLGVQFSFGGGIWQFSITPPIISAGYGLAMSVVTTNTVATNTGCE
jgi:RHS repeat-associated protein